MTIVHLINGQSVVMDSDYTTEIPLRTNFLLVKPATGGARTRPKYSFPFASILYVEET